MKHSPQCQNRCGLICIDTLGMGHSVLTGDHANDNRRRRLSNRKTTEQHQQHKQPQQTDAAPVHIKRHIHAGPEPPRPVTRDNRSHAGTELSPLRCKLNAPFRLKFLRRDQLRPVEFQPAFSARGPAMDTAAATAPSHRAGRSHSAGRRPLHQQAILSFLAAIPLHGLSQSSQQSGDCADNKNGKYRKQQNDRPIVWHAKISSDGDRPRNGNRQRR